MPSLICTQALQFLIRKAHLSILTLPILVAGCAVGPDGTVGGFNTNPQPAAAPTVTINTIPAGADISIQDNYVGVSPLTVPAPAGLRTSEAWRVEAHLPGYEVKHVKLGTYHPPEDQVITRMVESYSMIYSAPVGTKTIPAYYVLPTRIDIKLVPLPGHVPAPGTTPAPKTTTPSAKPATASPETFRQTAGVYQAQRSYSNGDTYVGQFRDGKLNGTGVYQFANGDRYEGEFRDNLIDGNGIFTCANGKTIQGPFSNLQPVGLVMNCN